jgi:Flp pilus assembly pilin Flp
MANDAKRPGRARPFRRASAGQALVEYSLIAVLVIIAIVAILTVTGPVVGNVFSNTVYNLLGNTFVVDTPYSLVDLQNIASAVASITPSPLGYETNTPLIPTCGAGSSWNRTWAPTAADPADRANGTLWAPCPPL